MVCCDLLLIDFWCLRSKAALAGYAQSFRGQFDAQVELFHYSEQDGLDADALEAQVLSASGASVLLLATSSYLWFDPEHYPRNVELCTILKKFAEIRVNFVVCPTTNSARDGWQQHVSDLQSVFGGFFPETGNVDTWTDFDPEQDLGQEQIRSLIYRAQHKQALQCQDVYQEPRGGWIWKPVGGFVLLLVAGFGAPQLMSKLPSLSSQLDGLQNETRDLRHRIQLRKAEVVHLRDGQSLQWWHGQSLKKWQDAKMGNATRISELASASESQGQKISEGEIQDLRAKVISHGKTIAVHEATIISHDQNMSELGSTSAEQSTAISHLNSTSELRSRRPEIRMNFVVCPTTESARDGWKQHQSDLQSVFGDFLPERGRPDTWTDFNPEQDIETEQIRSLARRVARPLNHQDIHHPPANPWRWQAAFAVLAMHSFWSFWLQWESQTQKKQIADLLAAAQKWALLGKTVGDLTANTTSLGKTIGVNEATINSHDQNISKLVSTSAEQSTKISHLNSTSELHGRRLSALSSQVEGQQEDTKFSGDWCAREVGHLRAQMSECSCNARAPDTCAATFYQEKAQQLLQDTKPMEIPSRNQSLDAVNEMRCQNGQCPVQQWLEWLTEGIRSTFALFLLHSVSF